MILAGNGQLDVEGGVDPCRTFLAALHAIEHELDPAGTVDNGREDVQRVRGVALFPRHEHIAEAPVQVCKRLEVPFGVTGTEACNVPGSSREVFAATSQ